MGEIHELWICDDLPPHVLHTRHQVLAPTENQVAFPHLLTSELSSYHPVREQEAAKACKA
jgi:hypothetical protein